MDKKFSEYYKLDEPQLRKHWEEDTFSFDANVLLNLYRYTPKTRDAFFDLLEKIKNRIWISYQACYEYQKNRLIVINDQKEAYREIRETLESKKREIEAKLNGFIKHPYLQASELKKQIDSAFQSISKDLDNLEKNHPDYLISDPIWERLTDLLKSKVGDDFTNDELEKLYRDGKRRYDENIPPGYMDLKAKKNESNRSLYGDLIIWRQVIAKAKEINESIILITDDLKEDWWYKFKGKTISPRPELIKEFRHETNKRINIYQADRFMEFANVNLKQSTSQEAIEEIRQVRRMDEKALSDFTEALISEVAVAMSKGDIKLTKIDKSDFEKAIEESIDDNKEKYNK